VFTLRPNCFQIECLTLADVCKPSYRLTGVLLGVLIAIAIRRRDAKVPAAKRILTALCHCAKDQQRPRQPILGTDLALLQG
jgi:hypothetical protein